MTRTKNSPARQRTRWMELPKRITTACFTRQDKLEDLSPDRHLDEADRRQTLKAVCKLNRDIARCTEEMAAMENADFGTAAIMEDPAPLMRIVVALMVIARLVASAGRQMDSVDDVVGLASGGDPEDALAARNLFRDDSPLRRYLRISYSATLDESSVRLKESGLNRILGNEPDRGSEEMTQAVALMTKWK